MLNIKLPEPLAKGLAIATLGIGCPLILYASTFPTRAWCDLKQTGTEVTATPIGQKSDFYWFLVGLGVVQGLAAWQLPPTLLPKLLPTLPPKLFPSQTR